MSTTIKSLAIAAFFMFIKVVAFYMQRLVRVFLDKLANVIGVVYPTQQNYLPAITDRILLKSAVELSNEIKNQKVTAETVIKTFIERVKTVNPHINAMVQNRFAEAILEAIEVDARVREELEGNDTRDGVSIHSQPFLGVPFTVKDSTAIKGMNFTSGSVKRKDVIAKEDADCVNLLRKAGAIPIGITNTPEMLVWWDSYNKLYGRTDNPYDKSRISGGSSGGEGALLGAAASVIGIGSDIGGSIRIPSNFCGVFGHKTTPGIIPLKGHHPEASPKREPFFSFGPMCRYATDLKPALKVLSGERVNMLKLDQSLNCSDLNVYYINNYDGDPLKTRVKVEIKEAIKKSVEHLKKKGANCKSIEMDLLDHSFHIWLCSMKTDDGLKFSEELNNRNGPINSWLELFKFFFGRSDHTLASIAESIIEKVEVDDKHIKKIQDLGITLKKELHQILGNNGILIYPSHPEPAPKHNATLLKFFNCGYTAIFNILQVPVTQVPMGLDKTGLPIGIQVIAGPFNDHLTISIAEELEKQFGGWISPSKIVC